MRVKFGFPHDHSTPMSSRTIQGKLRVVGLLTVQQYTEVTKEGSGQEGDVTLKNLWLT